MGIPKKKNKKQNDHNDPSDDGGIPDGDPVMGQRIFDNQCKYCHTIEGSLYANGPILGQVYGNKAATKTYYRYSEALRKSNIVWTRKNLFEFLGAPQKFIPRNYMYSKVKNIEDRINIIAYLEYHAQFQ